MFPGKLGALGKQTHRVWCIICEYFFDVAIFIGDSMRDKEAKIALFDMSNSTTDLQHANDATIANNDFLLVTLLADINGVSRDGMAEIRFPPTVDWLSQHFRLLNIRKKVGL